MADLCALVLTYNRKGLLRDCLSAIQQQTARCRQIIVLDNASTDGTLDMLQGDFPDVQAVRLRKNVGAAGGFAAGMRLAAATGAERIWVMDDDVICEPDALAELIAALDLTEADGLEPPFVVSTARLPDGSLINVPQRASRAGKANGSPNWPEYLDRGLTAVTRATFVSILLPRRTFERYGYPLASMFIWGEDTEFTYRVTQNESGFLSGSSRVLHVRAQVGLLDIRTESNPVRLRWHRYLTRNHIYTAYRHRGFIRMLWRVFLEARHCLHLLVHGQLWKASVIALGILEGLWYKPDVADFDSRIDEEAIEFMSPLLRNALGFTMISNDTGGAEPEVAPIDEVRNA